MPDAIDPDEPDDRRMSELRPRAPADCEIKIYESKKCVHRWRRCVFVGLMLIDSNVSVR